MSYLKVKDANGKINKLPLGKNGTSVTIKSISESDESGGENVVTFSDGKTLKVKNGRDGNGKNVSVPDYWRDAVNAISDTIKERQNEAGAQAFQFVWFSDPHGVADYKTNDTITSRVTDIGRVTQYAAEKFDIPFVAISGDIMSQASHSSDSSVLAEYEAIREILAPIDRDRLIYCKGNHDGAWFTANGVSYLKNVGGNAIYNAIYRRQSLERNRVFGGDGSYFYEDDSASKVRFIMLNCHTNGDGSVDANGYAVYNSMKNSVYGTEQLAWLAKTALDLPEGWGAVIMAHQPLIDSKDGDVLNGILKAYNNKTTYNNSINVSGDYWGKNVTDNTYKIVTANVNFASAKGEIIAMFVGHRHQDLVFAAADYGYACPVIVITTAGGDVRGTNTNYDRVVGTATETAIDIVTVDRSNGKIYCTRLGAGVDRIISYSGATIVTYSIANTLTNCKNSNGVSTVEAGKAYSGTITANSGYVLDSVKVTMGGTDVTSSVYSNGIISISAVTGNVVITANAVAQTAKTYSITNTLTNCTNSNSATVIEEKTAYNATITPKTGHKLETVKVTMGGADITSTAYNNGAINIASVTGNIVITANAVVIETSSYTNLFSTSGAGFSQSESGFFTNWMPYNGGDNNNTGTIYHIKGMSGLMFGDDNKQYNPYKFHFSANADGSNPTTLSYTYQNMSVKPSLADYDNSVIVLQHHTPDYKYIRFEFREPLPDNLVITANENIVD